MAEKGEKEGCRIYYLLNIDGMKGLGHAAFLLVDEQGEGLFYSYNGMQYSLPECLLGKAGIGKMKSFALNREQTEQFLTAGDLEVSDTSECDNFDRALYRCVSLLNNFEIVATSIISFFIFREVISRRLWFAILLITAASVILSFEGDSALAFNEGSLFVLGACICWGVENNCTRMISNKSSVEIVTIKGLFSGTGSFLIALFLGEQLPEGKWIAAAMLLGFVAYGLSIDFYIRAQKDLGAAKTSAYYSIAPFLGVFFGMLLLSERPGFQFYFALAIMIFSTVLLIRDSIRLQHTHAHVHVHTHEHRHGELVHTHEHSHAHEHLHVHGENAGQHEHIHDVLNDHNHKHEENEYGK